MFIRLCHLVVLCIAQVGHSRAEGRAEEHGGPRRNDRKREQDEGDASNSEKLLPLSPATVAITLMMATCCCCISAVSLLHLLP